VAQATIPGELERQAQTRAPARRRRASRSTSEGPSAYLMKSPPKQIADDEAYGRVERFIERHRRTKVKEPARA
jgi:hypothetical protein